MKKILVLVVVVVGVFFALHVGYRGEDSVKEQEVLISNEADAQQAMQTVRTIFNNVWDKANQRLMTTPGVGAQGVFETTETIMNNVWDKANNMLRVSGGGSSGGDVSSNTTVSVDGEVVVFNSTSGKSVKRATGSGIAHLASGVLSASPVNLATESTGNLPVAQLGGGTGAGTTTFWRGDGSWAVPAGSGGSMTNPMTTAGDMIVGGTDGTPTRVPLASQAFINVKLPPYNAVGDGVANDTAAIQAALDAAQNINPAGSPNGSGTVHLPPGIYSITSVSIPTQVVLQGSSMWGGGSTLKQVSAANSDAVKLKCRDDDGYYYGGVRDLSVVKTLPTSDTLGSGIGVTRTSGTCALGESAIVSDLYVTGFPVSGIQVLQGSAPLRITHVSVFANGQFGVDLRGQHQTVLLDSISGDNNGTALINVDGTGSTYDATMIRISNVKAETNTGSPAPGNPQETVVLLNELANARVTVENISATAGGGGVFPQEIVRLKGSKPILTRLIDAACSGCVNMLVAEVGAFTLPWSNEIHEVMIAEDGTYQIVGRNSHALRSVALGQNIPQMAYSAAGGLLTQKANVNGTVLQTLTRATDTAPTGSFVKYQTVAGADVWHVDATGTLVTGKLTTANFNGGTGASTTTFLRGDGTWVAPSGSGAVSSGAGNAIAYYPSTGSTVDDSTGLRVDGTSIVSKKDKVTAVSADTVLDQHNVVYVTTGGVNRVITLPDSTAATAGKYVVIKADSGTGSVVLTPTGTDTLNGVNSSQSVSKQWEMLEATLVSANGWHVMTGRRTNLSNTFFKAARCQNATASTDWSWDSGSSVGPVANCATAPRGILTYEDGARSAEQSWNLPTDASGVVTAVVYWGSESTTGNVVWQVAASCGSVGDGVIAPSSYVAGITAVQTTQFTLATTGILLNTTGCVGGDLMIFRVKRDVAHVSDTAANAWMFGVELIVERTGQ